MNYALYTLGCKLNYAESATYARALEAEGMVQAKAGEPLTCAVVNSCAVTEQGQRKCRQLLRRVRREHPGALIVMVGCYADLATEELASRKLADLILPRGSKPHLAKLVLDTIQNRQKKTPTPIPEVDEKGKGNEPYFPAYSIAGRTRAFLKVQDGCDYPCTYCTIPLARGANRSSSLVDALAAARKIVEAGHNEIVLTGVNTGEFGRGVPGSGLAELVQALDNIEGLERVRISSIESNHLNDNLLSSLADARCLMPHLHVPLQSGSDSILRAMKRRYNTRMYADSIARARRYLGDIFLGIDLIVGFPGEHEQEFEETLSLLRELRPAWIHVFPFSPRPGTPAASMPGRPPSEAVAERVSSIEALAHSLHSDYAMRYAYQAREVLVEEVNNGIAQGYTDNYLRAAFPDTQATVGSLAQVELLPQPMKTLIEAKRL